MENAKREEMLVEPVAKLINHLALPTIVSMLITSLYNMADTYWVAQLNNDSATAAVGVVFAIMGIIQALGFFCGHGSGNYISRALGANRMEDAKNMATTGIALSLILGVILALVGLAFIDPLARILGSTETMLPYSKAYMSWILIGAPVMMGSLVMNNQLRFQGNSFFSMIGITAGGILNIILDPLFIFGFDLGIAGAAIATILSQAVSFFVLLWGIYRSGSLVYHIKNIRLDYMHIKEIFRGGLPSLFRNGVSSVATAVLNLCAGPFGDAAIAALSIVSRITQFLYSVVIGFAQGFQPVCGYNYGAKQYARVKEAYSYTVKFGTIFITFMSILAIIFAPFVMTIFQSDASSQILEIGSACLRFQCLTLPLSVFVTVANMMLQVTGKTTSASLLAIMRQGIGLIPTVWLLSNLIGLLGLEISQCIADIISLAIAIPLVKSFFKEMDREIISN